MSKLSKAIDLFHNTLSSFKAAHGYYPTHLMCSKSFRDALKTEGDYLMLGIKHVYVPVNDMTRISPRFFIEGTMVDCVLLGDDMSLLAVDEPHVHIDMMESIEYEP